MPRTVMAELRDYYQGKHTIITGGSSGIGLAIARRVLGLGGTVTLAARRGPLLEEARAQLQRAEPDGVIHTLTLDVSQDEEVARTVTPHIEKHPAQILINNAGIVMPGRFLELDAKHYREQMEVNYFGAVHMCRAVLPQMVSAKSGHVANVGSLLSALAVYGYSAYAASKFALYGFSDALRAEMWPHNVRVTMVLPADTDTPQHAFELQHIPPETRAITGNVKMMTPESVAESLLLGMAKGRFEIIPGWEGRMSIAAFRWIPGVVRKFCDSAQRKVSS